MSVTLIAFNTESEDTKHLPKGKQIIGFFCALVASASNDIFDEDNVQVEQHLGESDSGSNSDLVGRSLSDLTLYAFDIENLVLNDNVEDHFSNEEEFEDNGDEDDDGGTVSTVTGGFKARLPWAIAQALAQIPLHNTSLFLRASVMSNSNVILAL
ncbi:hypothetical protein JHK87_047278 [Glycine soja]|nr:hypothetical protein JHK87_047278 [Glycine soja]